MNVFLIATLVASVALILTAPARAQESTVLVSAPNIKDGVVVEIIVPLKERRDAYNKATQLERHLISRGYRRVSVSETKEYSAICSVWPKQLEVGDATLRLECQSLAMWRGDDPAIAMGDASTATQAMQQIADFVAIHAGRIARPKPAPAPLGRDPSLRWREPAARDAPLIQT